MYGVQPPADALPAFREFVTHEKQRLTQKRQALVKSERDKRMAELLKFSQNFKVTISHKFYCAFYSSELIYHQLNKPIPDDLVKILAKDEERQRAIIEKSTKDAASTQARAIGATAALSATPAANPPTPTVTSRVTPSTSGNVSSTGSTSSKLAASPSVVSTKTPTSTATKSGRINMVIQSIPPFKGKKSQPSKSTTQAMTKPSGSGAGAQSTKNAEPAKADGAANKLNVNATSFRPNPKAVAFTPVNFYPITLVNSLTLFISVSRLPRTRLLVHRRIHLPRPNLRAYVDVTCSASWPVSRRLSLQSSTSPPVPNPFFGKVVLKKTPVHVKDDFNPFKFNKVAEASAVSAYPDTLVLASLVTAYCSG